MADFTTLNLRLNTGSQATPTWTAIGQSGSGVELRFSDQSNQGTTPSASWPFMTRPGSVQHVPYQYAFSADTTALGYLGSGTSTPATWANTNFNDMDINWDAVGTFASALILTAYYTTGHASITRGDNDILGGNTTDTGATARSYMKANLFGRVVSAGAPAGAPTNAPAATDGSTGSVSPTAGANWLTNYQGLQGDNDYITAAATPAATTADQIRAMLDLWTGPNMSTGTKTPVISVKYTFA
jgi:hypothetical protein